MPVGTTTIRLGLARQGPLAPVACQLGKYDVLTSTGTPGSETSKLTVSSLLEMSLTVTAGSQTRSNSYNGDGVLVAQTATGTLTRYTQDLASPLSQAFAVADCSAWTVNASAVPASSRFAPR